MARASRLVMMAGGLGVALFSVATLKNWVGKPAHPPGPSLAIEQESEEARSAPARLTHQPQVLQAKPLAGKKTPSPPYRNRQIPADGYYETARPEYPSVQLSPANPASAEVQSDGGLSRADVPPMFPQVPNALAEDLLDSAIRLPGNPPAGWPAEPSQQPPTWTTQENDSLWDISVSRYGNGSYYHALFAHNRTRIYRPDRIEAGIVLETPAVEILQHRFPELCPAATPGGVTRARLPDLDQDCWPGTTAPGWDGGTAVGKRG